MAFGRLAGLILLATTQSVSAQEALTEIWSAIFNSEAASEYESTQDNYRLTLPAGKYRRLDPAKLNQGADHAFVHLPTKVIVFVAAEPSAEGVSLSEYAKAKLQPTQTSSRSKRFSFTNIRTTEQVDPKHGNRFDSTTTRSDDSTTSAASLFESNGMFYLIMARSNAGLDQKKLKKVVDEVMDGLTILDDSFDYFANVPKDTPTPSNYRSAAFPFEVSLDNRWNSPRHAKTSATVDFWAESPLQAHYAVRPLCWSGRKPKRELVLNALLESTGVELAESYEKTAKPATIDGGRATRFEAKTQVNGKHVRLYDYWFVEQKSCAYLVSLAAPERAVLNELSAEAWAGFSLLSTPYQPAALSLDQQRSQAQMLDDIGLALYLDEQYRNAFGLFSQAFDLATSEDGYLTNAAASLNALGAYQEALDWLEPRLTDEPSPYVLSWHAILLKRAGQTDVARAKYRTLFDGSYQDDEDFGYYADLLADEEAWDELWAAMDRYEPADERVHELLRIDLLTRQDKFADALAAIDALDTGALVDRELAMKRIDVYDGQGLASKIREQADLLLDEGYSSAQIFFWKGYAEYELGSYKALARRFC